MSATLRGTVVLDSQLPALARMRGEVVRALLPLYLVLIAGLPFALVYYCVNELPPGMWRGVAMIVAAPGYCVLFAVVAALLSRLTLRSIVAGRFVRQLTDEVYGPRRLYAICWTAIVFCGPVYHLVLSVPTLKRIVFRLFGYRGSMDFQVYPDTWIRDLPLLSIGEGAYLSNKATISPNMCLRNGTVIVAPVAIGAGTMIGHLSMIAPGVVIGRDSEIGVGAAVGLRVRVGAQTHVDHEVVVDHEATIGDNCLIGNSAYIGRRAVVRDRVKIPPCAIVPARAVIANQAEADALGQGVRAHGALIPNLE